MKGWASPFTDGPRVIGSLPGHTPSPFAWGSWQAGSRGSWQPGSGLEARDFDGPAPPRTKSAVGFPLSLHNFHSKSTNSNSRFAELSGTTPSFLSLGSRFFLDRIGYPTPILLQRDTHSAQSDNGGTQVNLLAERRPLGEVQSRSPQATMYGTQPAIRRKNKEAASRASIEIPQHQTRGRAKAEALVVQAI